MAKERWALDGGSGWAGVKEAGIGELWVLSREGGPILVAVVARGSYVGGDAWVSKPSPRWCNEPGWLGAFTPSNVRLNQDAAAAVSQA